MFSSYWYLLATVLVVSTAFELNLEPDELVKAQRESSGKFFYYDSNSETLMLNRSLFVYRQDNYGNWSFWSECSEFTCLQHRYKMCLDNSYKKPMNYPTTNRRTCPFKYIVEERPCEDTSRCLINAKPSEELERMEAVCGNRGSSDEEPNKKDSRRRYRYDDEEFYDEEREPRDRRRDRRRHQLKIIGGRTAKSMSWPWNVAIYKAGKYNPSDGLTPLKAINVICGGTLIAQRWVLTAAHCLKPFLGSAVGMQQGVPFDMNSTEMGKVSMLVRVGDSELEGTRDRNEKESDHLVDQVIIHPEWVPARPNSPYDIALLRLATDVDIYNGDAGVACLPKGENSLPPEDATCYAVGWGDSSEYQGSRWHFNPWWFFGNGGREKKNKPDMLKEIRVSVQAPWRCFRDEEEESDVQICAGRRDAAVCSGDNGGGLFCRNDSTGKWYVYGVLGSGPMRRCKYNRWLYNAVDSVTPWLNRYVV